MNELNRHNVTIQRVLVFILWIITAMLVFRADNPYELKIAFLLLPLLFVRQIFVSLSWIDIAVFLLWLYDLTGCLTGINPLQTMYSLESSTLCLLGYIAIRYISENKKNLQFLLKGICFLTSISVLLAVLSFFVFQHSVESAGFEELYSFRFLFRPLGYPTNSWNTVLTVILGFILITYHTCSSSKAICRLLCAFFAITVFTILLSFSRGVYIGLVMYVILLLIGVKSYKYKLTILGCVLLVGGVVYFFFPKETCTTIRMNTTVSQQQSNKGRIQASQVALKVFSERMLCGAGKGNYTLAVDKQLNQNSTVGYTSFAPNILVRWAIEKGLIGILLYLFLAFCIGKELWQKRKNNITIIAGCTLFAVFVKEMSLETISSTPVCVFLCAFLLAMAQVPDNTASKPYLSGTPQLCYGVLTIIGISYLMSLLFIVQHTFSENYRKESISAYQRGNYKEAIRLIEKTKKQTPYLICRAVIYMKCFEHIPDSNYLEKAIIFLADAHIRMPEDVYIEYLQAKLWRMKGEENKAYNKLNELVTAYPANALYRKELASLLYNRNKKEAAVCQLEKAIRLYPSILNMKDTQYLESTDSTFYQSLKDSLLKEDSGTAPADYARYGYILYYCGDRIKAERYLTEAVSLLPNLSTPWYLLGEMKRMQHKEAEAELCMKKFHLLTRGAYQSSSVTTEGKIKDVENYDLIQGYVLKFSNWYRSAFIL